MQNIINMAGQLGELIAASDQAAALRAAQETVEGDEKITALLNDFQAQARKMQQLEQSGSVIEVADKHQLSEIRGKLLAEERFVRLSEAQMEYADLLRRVNQTIEEKLGGAQG